MSFIKYEYININKFSRPGIKNYGIKGLIMHYTANNGGTARNHKTYFNNLNGIYASAHLFVDDDEAICIIPFDEVAYHANDTVKYNADGTIYKPLYSKIGNANFGAIGLEMCLDKNGNITEKTFQNSVKAVKELVAKYPAITRNTIWRHYDVTGKNCPAPWVSKPSELERFKEAVFANTPNKVVQQIITQGSSAKISGLGYRLHVQSKSPYKAGTLGYVKEGATAGTTGKGLRAEWLEILYDGKGSPFEIDTHVQKKGWLGYRKGSQGTKGESLRMEAVRIRIADAALAKTHSIMYRVHSQTYGWGAWVKDGEVAGTTGKSKRLEAIQIKLIKK